MSIAEYRRRGGVRAHKYSAKAIVVNGLRFDSKLEGDRYLYWLNRWQARSIAWFTRQVPFYLPGGVIYRADFIIVQQHDTIAKERFGDAVIVEDCKGFLTEAAAIKLKQVEAIYGFQVQLIKRGKWA